MVGCVFLSINRINASLVAEDVSRMCFPPATENLTVMMDSLLATIDVVHHERCL